VRSSQSFENSSATKCSSKGQKDFHNLAEEVIGSQVQLQRHEFVNSLASQLEAISATADELLSAAMPAKPEIRAIAAQRTEEVEQAVAASEEETDFLSTEAKLSDYYGVNQMSDAVVFVTLYPRADTVQLAGDFNNWQPAETPMEKVGDSGIWQAKLKLPSGRHRYRLVVDGQWQQDPYNEAKELNPFGDFNSVVEVK
jgi:predicted phage tail protein